MARAVRATGRRYLVERPREGGGWRAATQRGLLRALPLALLLSFRAAAKSGASLPAREQALLLSFLVVVAITTRIFRAFVCLPFATDGAEPPAQRFYLADDLSVECDGLEYAKVASCAVAMSSRRHNACHHTLMTGVGGRLRRGYARAVAGWTHPLLLGAGLSPSPRLGPHLTSTSPPPRPLSPPTSAPIWLPSPAHFGVRASAPSPIRLCRRCRRFSSASGPRSARAAPLTSLARVPLCCSEQLRPPSSRAHHKLGACAFLWSEYQPHAWCGGRYIERRMHLG